MKQIIIILLFLIGISGCGKSVVIDDYAIVVSTSECHESQGKYEITIKNGTSKNGHDFREGIIITNIQYQPGDTIHLCK